MQEPGRPPPRPPPPPPPPPPRPTDPTRQTLGGGSMTGNAVPVPVPHDESWLQVHRLGYNSEATTQAEIGFLGPADEPMGQPELGSTTQQPTTGPLQEEYEEGIEDEHERSEDEAGSQHEDEGGDGDEGEGEDEDEDEDSDQDGFHQGKDWILEVTCPTAEQHMMNVVRIHIYAGMTTRVLGRCLSQSTSSSPYTHLEPIVGLFCQQDGVFFSLEYILTSEEARGRVYSIASRHEGEGYIRSSTRLPWWRTNLFFFGLAIVGAVSSLLFGPTLTELSWVFIVDTYYIFFEIPLRELYRYGPYLVGWEGASLPEICARVTYHGDRGFWSRNLEECELIYAKKEEAFLRVSRPAGYATMTFLFFWALRHLVIKRAEHRRNKPDDDMVETYRAFQTLLRQVSRVDSSRR